jgi:hypothetical protein
VGRAEKGRELCHSPSAGQEIVRESLQPARFDGLSKLSHQIEIEMQVVDGV